MFYEGDIIVCIDDFGHKDDGQFSLIKERLYEVCRMNPRNSDYVEVKIEIFAITFEANRFMLLTNYRKIKIEKIKKRI